MNKILAISYSPPMPDLHSGDLRFYSILKILARNHGKVTLVAKDLFEWHQKTPDSTRYKTMLADIGVILHEGDIFSALNSNRFDYIIFEFYYMATEFSDLARRLQPQALSIIDSVDIHFSRLQAKAKLTNSLDDKNEAEKVRTDELNAYQNADIIIAVSEDDKSLLQDLMPDKYIFVLPNVHAIHEIPPRSKREFGRLVFIGGFSFPPNLDAILYFLNEIMPLIRAKTTEVKLSIIGSNIPQKIFDMAATDVDVIGFVPETTSYLQSAYISIAPLRYGGGMKGKVGEALSHGLPVVTTQFGAEGFGLTPGRDLLVAETPDMFAEAVLKLLADSNYYDEISKAGHRFISDNYSTEAMEIRLANFLEKIKEITPIKLPWHKMASYCVQRLLDKHIMWRIKSKQWR
ncbi:glycosyltransferase family 4 protein [Methylomonas koyamae]|uniref:glycosyltransferase family 4 protein n=1 Tax=Methylomonas koyamae TaxID=702114 RepID=UPI002872E9CE|nr:glycosyltransferase family 4 protein [Methylomonas koyamae]WNB78116.1 glycosyltransferase family 4 protein [Methylomonas koyamae]